MKNADKTVERNLKKTVEFETTDALRRFKEFLFYDPDTGQLKFSDTRFGAKQVGQVAGYVDKGYVRIQHRDRKYMAHRVAWALHHDKWPEHTIDHINRDGTDNRIQNLRDVPQAVNNQNKSKYKKKT